MMRRTPKSLRLQIGLFGRTNVGKSTFLNYITAQDVSITSPDPGTTTDVVEKAMELLPVGPVLFLDTAGLNDISRLADLRLKKTEKIFDRADVFVLIVEPETWGEYEESVINRAIDFNLPVIIVVNKCDLREPSREFLDKLSCYSNYLMSCSSIGKQAQSRAIGEFKQNLIKVCPDDFLNPPSLISDLVKPGRMAMLIVPIDLQAPKGRLILPQVQAIRDALDNDSAVVVAKEREFFHILESMKLKPDIVVCDSQVVLKMVADVPPDIKCTTFSILFARYKGDLTEMAGSLPAIDRLKSGDRVLIAESCSHHPIEDDIGRVKIPRWLRQYSGADIKFDVSSGRDFPDRLQDYKLIIQCGGCMMSRREVLARIFRAKQSGVPITNYGLAISFLQGVADRTLVPFPAARDAFKRRLKQQGELR